MPGNNERLIFVGLKNLVGVGDVYGFFVVRDRAFGQIGVRGLQRLAHGFQAHAVAIQLRGIYFHAHRRPRAAPHEYLANTFYLCQLLRQDGIGRVVNFCRRHVFGSQRQQQNGRVGGIHLAIGWLARKIRRQLTARRVDGGLHVASRGIHIAIKIKLQNDAGVPQPARGSHLRNARDATELPLQRSGHGRCHGFRAGARQACAYRNCWEIDLRQRRYRQKVKRHCSRKKNRNSDQ